jgi:branched-chain amino acid transport system ATP-binding protein
MNERAPMLEVRHLTAGYGQTIVVRDLSLTVPAGRCVVIIGPNGHGKTTLLRAVSGLLKPMAGEIVLDGERIDEAHADRIAMRGMIHIPQGDGLFADMSVEENLLMGSFPKASWRDRQATLERVYELFPIVLEKREQHARTLSGGERRLVGLGRGLMREGKILLIDEPSLGLAPVMIDTVYSAIKAIVKADRTVLLIEENFTHIGDVADEVHVLESGAIVRSGSLQELMNDRTVVETYLGSL